VGMVFEQNGKIIATAAGAEVLGHPAVAVAWLANKLAEYGQSLEAGEVILSGALTKAMEIAENDTFRASFGGLGSVKGRFVG
jgi:2-keto-4-pentenoate hydratase